MPNEMMSGKIITIAERPASLDDLFEQFTKQERGLEGRSPVTIKNYRDNYGLLKGFKPDISLRDLNPDLMVDFFTYLDERKRLVGRDMVVRKLENSSKATIRAKLNTFFTFLVDRKLLEESPFEGIDYPNVSYTDKRSFTKKEFDKIYLAVTRDIKWETKLVAKRNIAMIMFAVTTGVRKGEHLNTSVNDLDLSNRHVTIQGRTSKSKRTRTVSLNPELNPYLEDYFREREDYTTPYLWVSNNGDRNFTEHGLKHFINKLSHETGINCHLHRFRHTFACNLYLQTKDVLLVHRALGHKSLKQTLSYLRSIPDDVYIQELAKMTVAQFV